MALAIRYTEETKYGRTPLGRWLEWHIGDPMPKDLGRVVMFQADGHELNLVLKAMRSTKPKSRVMKNRCFETPYENT